MARDVRVPGLIWRPLPENRTQPLIVPRVWIVHTAVDAPGPTDLHGYFARPDITLESHTWLRWDRHEQLMSADVRADANYLANPFAFSTETEDDGSPVLHPWNGYQVSELVRIGVWLNKTFGIPPEPPKTWNGTGMGYHSQFPNHWTNVRGKTCPGATRIQQWNDDVLPRIRAAIYEESDDMPPYIAWYKDKAGKTYPYHMFPAAGIGKYLTKAAYDLCRYLGTPEKNTSAKALDATWQSTVWLVDGPCASVQFSGSGGATAAQVATEFSKRLAS